MTCCDLFPLKNGRFRHEILRPGKLKSRQHVDLQEVIEQCLLSSVAAVILAVSQGVQARTDRWESENVPDIVPDFRFYHE